MTTDLGSSQDFIIERAEATRAAQTTLQSQWVWPELDLPGWDAALAAVTDPGDPAAVPPRPPGLRALAKQAEGRLTDARSALDKNLDEQHRQTLLMEGIAKTRFRNDRTKLAAVAHLEARGDSRRAIRDEAGDAEVAWEEVGEEFVPAPGVTLSGFKKLRADEPKLNKAFKVALSDFRKAAGNFNAALAELDDFSQAWYAEATRVFPAGTPAGDTIRSTVPTTYTPPPAVPAASVPPAPAP